MSTNRPPGFLNDLKSADSTHPKSIKNSDFQNDNLAIKKEFVKPTLDKNTPYNSDMTADDVTRFMMTRPVAKKKTKTIGMVPEILNDRYRLEKILGVGGMGQVYLACDLLRKKMGDPSPWVAIKILSEDFRDSDDCHALLYTEYALTIRMRHNNIIRSLGFDIDLENQMAFIVFELLSGQTMDSLLIDKPQGVDADTFYNIAIPLLHALRHAHQQGIVHGDLKPSNVILAKDGVKLFDFGLGQPLHKNLASLPRLSQKNIAAWTPRYAALEVLEGKPLSEKSDIFSMACVLMELSQGNHPFRRLTSKQAQSQGLGRDLRRSTYFSREFWNDLKVALSFEESKRNISVETLVLSCKKSWNNSSNSSSFFKKLLR